MIWDYEQLTGKLSYNGEVVAIGYSGHGDGVNAPSLQDQPFVGPIPVGFYKVGTPFNGAHSPFTLPLTPYNENAMFGRNEFEIHGDEIANPGKQLASDGCIILDRGTREKIWNSADHILQVVSGILS